MPSLIEQLKATEIALAAARVVAANIANEEGAALGNDESWLRWSRQKKLAGVEAARLEDEIAKIKTEIDAGAVLRQQRGLATQGRST